MMADRIMKKLPEDVLVYILLRLSVKFLLRFKCVSRTCYTIIQSSGFVNLHLNRTTTSNDENILFKRSYKNDINKYKAIFSFLSSDGDDYLNCIFPDVDVPYITSPYIIDYDQVIGPFQGLIALMDAVITILFNPSTRNYRLLPTSPFNAPKGFRRSIECAGFGFDCVVNDYKAVRIYDIYNDDRYGYAEHGERKVEIYELGIDIWRELEHVNLQLPRLFWLNSSMFYNGAYHWIATSEGRLVILCFDLSTEIFRIIKTPNIRRCSNGTRYSFILLNGSIGLICYPCLGPMVDPMINLIDIWILKNYNVNESWGKKYTIRCLPIESPLAVWKDYLLLYQSKNGHFMSYDLNSDEVVELNLHGCPKSMRVIVYQDSLTPIPRGSTCSTQVHKF
ncbi:F-box protein CPR1-like [Solanum stenotomum]|uniref:F-box protein CPR1-like n=1 Tax=Solanum stenotomum TaxID=172797 RepID=UPI0020D0CD9E|nr:F-box protein CPR1-like [Solanum stenotomum]